MNRHVIVEYPTEKRLKAENKMWYLTKNSDKIFDKSPFAKKEFTRGRVGRLKPASSAHQWPLIIAFFTSENNLLTNSHLIGQTLRVCVEDRGNFLV